MSGINVKITWEDPSGVGGGDETRGPPADSGSAWALGARKGHRLFCLVWYLFAIFHNKTVSKATLK